MHPRDDVVFNGKTGKMDWLDCVIIMENQQKTSNFTVKTIKDIKM